MSFSNLKQRSPDSGSRTLRALLGPRRACFLLAGLLCVLVLGVDAGSASAAVCDPPVENEIACENSKQGDPESEWDVSGAGNPDMQGFATDISVDQGETVHFKIDTAADVDDYRLDIYRMGYYNGDGARKVDTVQPSASLPQAQPPCNNEAATGLIDCANWNESASWNMPADAVSGIYFAKLVREDESAEGSHIVFIVRDDDGGSNLLFQTMDTTWQAYNQYGGNSLYVGGPGENPGRAYKVSYNRPFTSRGPTPEDWVFNAEYPMVRWLERNGYDVSYFTGVDSDRRGDEILEHDAFLSVGHDEYWSGGQRNNVEAARAAGVNLAFFSGNEVFWKTRWEDNHSTLVSYKETHANQPTGAKIDPTPTWTGTWRDPRFSPPSDGGRPENALTGTIFTVNDGTTAIEVPAADGKMRLWRNTTVAGLAPGQTATLSDNTLGYEWDEDLDNGSRPPGLVRMSTTTEDVPQRILDHGSNYGPGTATHHLTLYRHQSGALVFGAGTIQWPWGLDGNHDRGGSTADPRMQQATANLFADMGVQPDTLQAGLVPATASTDDADPSSQIDSPLDGSNVESGQATTISGTATDAGGGQVGGVEVSVDGGNSWHPADGRGNWTYSWTPGATGNTTIRTRAADDSGNLESPGAGVTVNVVPRTCPCSIWDDSVTPPIANDPASPDGVELGVKFRSDEGGFITGLRFYKGAQNTGTHVGHLWEADGTMLGEATFTGESASGWQQVSFDSPVPITADTTYVASYHAPNGNYASTNGYFATDGTDSPPLHALADGEDGPNGVYRYGSGGVFPTDTFQSSNYWVDPVFDTDAGQDETPPTINARSPSNGASGVGTGTDVTATFSEAMDANTIDGNTVELRDPSNALVPAGVSYSSAQRRVTLDPNDALQHSTTYAATVKGGTNGVKDTAGNELAADSSWSFTTAAPPPPPPDEGPGGPILVVSNSSNPFGRYYAEILRAEGLNEFRATDISNVNAATLDAHDVVILGEGPVSAAQAQMLSDWVQDDGGNLIAMRPDDDLNGLLGLQDAGTTLSNAYLQVDASDGPGEGIVDDTIQYHGAADRYTPNGADTVATLFSDATTGTPNPAVTLRDVGPNGGQAAAFTYDLARSIVYTRQGNPAWAGQERDGESGPIRSDDLFFGDAAGDPQPDWVDLDKVAIPQADEQQRLLTNLIGHMNVDRKPLPRFWFLPRSEKAAIVMTGDDHGNGGTIGRFDQYRNDSPQGCSVADWECVRGTSYIYENTPMTNAQAAAYEADGFEVALHVNTNCNNWTSQANLDSFYSGQLNGFGNKYTSLSPPSTNRTHCIAWSDWASQPKVELAHGIRLDTNYYYWPPDWVQNRPGMFTGSGMPMRFADLDGSMIDVYQAATQMTDESGQTFPFNADELLDNALGAEGYYGVFTANMHTDNASHAGSDAIVDSAQSRGVPVVSARQMLQWIDGRNGSSFDSLSWDGNQLDFTIEVGAGANGLRAMVPTDSEAGPLANVQRNGASVPTSTETIKGVEYAFFDAAPGNYEATFAADATPPVISDLTAAPGSNGSTATVTWDTDEQSDSRVDYGTSPDSLTSNESETANVTSHSVELSNLDPNTTYYYRVTSRDAANNPSTEPPGAEQPASFTTPSASFIDTTVSHFGQGTTDANTYISQTDDGEVILKPTVGEEFSGGPELPSGWQETPWNVPGQGGSATVSGGKLHANGASAGTVQTYGEGRSLEFAANFGGANFQHVGFGVDFNQSPNWAMFSVKSDGSFAARTNNGGAAQETPLPGSLLGSPHRYRVDWTQTEIRYLVDGNLVATHPIGATGFGATQMRPIASDLTNGDSNEVSVEWLRMSPYPAAPGNFHSRVFDAGQSANWGGLSWTADTPAGTGVAMSVRTGNTPTPDQNWTSFTPIASSGGSINASSRYIQYRADLSSSDPATTPTLRDVAIAFNTGEDTTAPTITGRDPSPDATDVPRGSNVEVQFSEAMDPATIDSSSFSLRRQGSGTDVAANVSASGATATLNPNADLAANAVYEATVKGTVEDANGNPLGSDLTWTFTTAPLSATDTTVGDFGQGTTDANTYISQTDDGEVILKPTVGEEFSGGPELPSGWQSCPWTNPECAQPDGPASVSGGSLHVDGAWARTAQTYGSGSSLEFMANFGASANLFQHVGFGVDLNNSPNWAMFSVKGDGSFAARTNNGGATQETPLPGSLLGSPHRYRVDWTQTEIRYLVDGNLVATHPIGPTGFGATQMRPIASDFNSGGSGVSVDWLRMSPYTASGTFQSRVFDAGQSANWGGLSWNADTTADTSVALSVRTGNSPSPDGTWTSFTAIATSGDDIPGNSRYVQYKADLSSSDSTETPALTDVTISYGEDSHPTAVNDQKTVAEDDPATAIDVLANDTDPDGGPRSISGVTQPQNGEVVVANDNQSLTYKPDADYCNSPSAPTDDFTYSVSPGGSTATVAVRVTCADDNPTAVNDQKTVAEDDPATAIDVLANDTDPDGGPRSISGVTQPQNGEVVVANDNQSLTYKPDADYCNSPSAPTDDFTYSVSPGGSTATVAVRVTCADDNPTAVNDQKTVAEDDPATAIDVLANDTDPDGGPRSISGVTQPQNGEVVVANDNQSLTYKPDADYCNSPSAPTDDFTYSVSPGGSTATVAVRVTCADDNPTAVNDQKTVAEDDPATAIDVLANDTDPDGGPRSISGVTQPQNGEVVVANDNQSLTYKPDADYCNSPSAPTDDFTYSVSPGGSTATVAVRVTCADDNPTAVNDQKTVAEDDPATAIDVLANDTDPDGGPRSISGVTQPQNGEVVVANDNQSLTYKPDADYCNSPSAPTDDFTYSVSPGGSTATVAVRVTCADDNPTAVNDQKTVAEDDPATAIDVLANDTDPDGGPRSISGVTQPQNGEVVVANDNQSLTYKPDADYCNSPSAPTDDFTYTVSPGGSTATVAVRVTCADDNPTAVNDQKTVAEDDPATAIDVLANDTDPDGGPRSISGVTQPQNGEVVVANDNQSLTYKPDADYCNSPSAPTDDFTYTVSPGGSTATVAVRVTCADDNPTAVNDQKTVAEDDPATAIDVLANDTDPDGGPRSISGVTQPQNGEVVVANDNQSLTYKPDADYCNSPSAPTDDFTYSVSPGGSTATVAVRVTCADDNPTAVNDQKTVAEDDPATAIDVLANDTDPDGGPRSISGVTQPQNGEVVVANDNQSLTYKPDADYCNSPSAPTDDFTYTVSPGGSTATVAVRVTCVDDGPAAPTITDTDPDSPANDRNPEVKGTAGGGNPTQVRLYKSANCSGSVAATGTVAQFTGAGITVNVPNNSTTNLSARAFNAAGNTSACSNSISYINDSSAPAKPTLTDTDPDSPANDIEPEVKGTVGGGNPTQLKLYKSANCSGSVAATGTVAQFTGAGITVNVPNISTTNLSARATDAAGNDSACSNSISYVEVDGSIAAPTITDTDPNSPANDRNPEVKGTVGGGNPTQVRLYKSANCSGSVAATGTVAQFTGAGITVNVPNNSTTNLSARAFNAAGNGSICSSSISYVELR